MWTTREVDNSLVSELARELRLHPAVARCLAGRGVKDLEAGRRFVSPRLSSLRAPTGLAGLEPALERIIRAVEASETIGVFGDYDVDGITTCTVLTGFLRELGATVVPRVAHRAVGYGLNVIDVKALISDGASVIITGDCGTSDLEAITEARARGVDVIVIDHHTVPDRGETESHPALALVNPFRGDSEFEFRGLASVGLAFYFIAALRTALAAKGQTALPDPRHWLDLVAVGTIADLVPLCEENRILTAHGLRALISRPRAGIDALLRLAKVERDQIDERTVSWKLGPRINAPGRLGDAGPALELLLSDGLAMATMAAASLEQANDTRRLEQQRVLVAAQAQLGPEPGPCVVVSGDDWPAGVVGIVAAKLVEATARPAFVIAVDRAAGIGRGSARTAAGVNLYQALSACAPLLMRYGGHAAAAGLTVAVDKLDALTERLREVVKELVQEPVNNCLNIDEEVELRDVAQPVAEQLGMLAPFGRGNDEPVFATTGLTVRESRCVGDGTHLKLTLESKDGTSRGAIGFGMGKKQPGVGAVVNVAYVPVINRFAGKRSVELELRGLW